MNLFIDTNIWLSLYHFTRDDLEELRKVGVLVDQGKLTLHQPQQGIDEFWRNRDAKIADALKRFRDSALPDQFPQICKNYPEHDPLREAVRAYHEQKGRLLDSVTKDAAAGQLAADEIIAELFSKAQLIPLNDAVVDRARLRSELGNPPGKKNSLGDAINWECLVSAVPNGEDLFFVSEDIDYRGTLNGDEFNPFLKREWRSAKSSDVMFFRRLADFFADKFKGIKLATELDKELLTRDLHSSPNFARSRRILRRLAAFDDFTDEQVAEIATAASTNNQVYWIARDEDIRAHLLKIVAARADRLSPEVWDKFRSKTGVEKPHSPSDT